MDGPKDLVLAEGEHGIELTLAEYNARSEDFPLPAELDTLEARKQLLELLVDHKVVAAEGRLRGYGARDASNLREEEDALVQQMIRSNVREAQSINDAEARQFFESRIEEFSGLTPDDLGDPATLLHVKFTMNDLRWRSLKVKWRQREAVVVHEDRFAALQAAASESFLYSNEESR